MEQVKSSDREPLVPMSMNLTTQVRAEQRKMYEESQQERLLRQQQEQQASIDAIKVIIRYNSLLSIMHVLGIDMSVPFQTTYVAEMLY